MNHSKLLTLKRYVTLSEAAERLTRLFGESVTVIDILEWVLDKKIVLSVKFPYGVKVIACKYGEHRQLQSDFDRRIFGMFHAPKELRNEHSRNTEEYKKLEMEYLKDQYKHLLSNLQEKYENEQPDIYQEYLKYKDKFTFDFYMEELVLVTKGTIGKSFYLDKDIYDFPLVGTERVWIENLISSLKRHTVVERFGIDGSFLLDEDGNILSLRERFENSPEDYPADNLPEDHELVITTKHLLEFEQSLMGNDDSIDYKYSQLLLASILKILKESSPKKWTQGELSDLISEQSQFKGLGKRKIDSFFSQCNKLLDNSIK